MSDTTEPGEALGPIREQRERLANTADAFEQAITSSAGDVGPWKSLVQETLVEVGDALANHVEMTEGPDGLYTDVLERTPRLTYRVERLRDDHDDLRRRIAALEPLLAEPPSEPQVESIRDRGFELLEQISRHRSRGSDLIYESYDFDIGTGE